MDDSLLKHLEECL